MENKTFNDCIIDWSAQQMVSKQYAKSIDEAKEWLLNRDDAPRFKPTNSKFSSLGEVKTLERLCGHAYKIISHRRSGIEPELPVQVKAYYTPRFQNLLVGKSFYA